MSETASRPHPRVGHVHLKVADLDRAIRFYRDALGLAVVQLVPERVAFMACGGYHHHVALNASSWKGAAPAPRQNAGLLHAAFSYPSRRALAEAIYFDDPDGNGVEISWDCPCERWQYLADGTLNVALGIPFDPNVRFLGEVSEEPPPVPAA